MNSLRKEIVSKQNKLAEKLTSVESPDDLVSILNSHRQLWNQITGLPPKCSHIAVDLAMACNICISAIRVWLISGDCMFSEINHIYRVAIERVVCCQHSEHSAEQCLNCGTAFVANCIQKLIVFTEITNALSGQVDSYQSLHHYLTIKNKVCDNPVDVLYFNAYMLYEESKFLECINYLYRQIHLFQSDLACFKLLLGNCYYQLNKYHSSVYYYSQCLGDSTCSTMAMRNCAIAYQAIGNVEAELEMRKLLVQAIKEKDSASQDIVNCERMKVYYHSESSQLSYNVDKNDSVLAMYHLGKRALECGKYLTAISEFEAVIETEKQLLPSVLPPLSVLHLMLYKAFRLNTSNPSAGEHVVDRLYEVVKSSYNKQPIQGNENWHHLLYCTVLWLRADGFISKGYDLSKARDLLVSCLSCADHVIHSGHQSDSLLEFKDMILNNLLYVNHHIQQERR